MTLYTTTGATWPKSGATSNAGDIHNNEACHDHEFSAVAKAKNMCTCITQA